jgi:5-methylcytosine-specific restriction endonuclease McrA
MGNQIANAWLYSGNNFLKLGKYEEALRCFIKVLELEPQISVPFSNIEDMEKFIRREGIRTDEQIKETRQRYIELEKKRRLELENKRQLELESARKREEESRRWAIKNEFPQFIREIEYCADERPCPKCYEIEIFILSLSPNARSLSVRCKHCQHEYRIKIEPDDPQKITKMFNSLMEGTENALPVWHMTIRKRQSANQRKPILSSVKKAVWKRDGGKCVNCGSDIAIEYDHIIPVAKGGSSTIQNIQILCQKCNRKKSASIE